MTKYNLSPPSPPGAPLKPVRSPEIRPANQEPQQWRKQPAGSGPFRISLFGLPSTFDLRTSDPGRWSVVCGPWSVARWTAPRPARPIKPNPTKSNQIKVKSKKCHLPRRCCSPDFRVVVHRCVDLKLRHNVGGSTALDFVAGKEVTNPTLDFACLGLAVAAKWSVCLRTQAK